MKRKLLNVFSTEKNTPLVEISLEYTIIKSKDHMNEVEVFFDSNFTWSKHKAY